ncbi:MAG TPA: response regulator [Fibrobacteria bacterium]|nr:response regulator [Fibrobacteria bacterium]HOX53649.1 response regulator [Fibrobacteria bacterium]
MTKNQPPLAGKTVLLVEDDGMLMPLLQLVLEEVGAKVLATQSPSEALDLVKSASHVDVLVTDIVLPERSGFLLAADIAIQFPKARVLFISGFGDPEIGARDLHLEFDTLLKPFHPEDFTAKVVALARRK